MYTNRVFGTAKCVLFIKVFWVSCLEEFHCSDSVTEDPFFFNLLL